MSSEETAGQLPDAVLAEAWSEYCYPSPAVGPFDPRFKRAMTVVNQWLAGGVVVDLPELEAGTAAWVGDYSVRFGHEDDEAHVSVFTMTRHLATFDPDTALRLGAALLAAACAAERLSVPGSSGEVQG